MTTLSKINIPNARKPRILVAPLDWGLGHATRCIPIIKELLFRKCEVVIAASGDPKTLLLKEFPALSFVELPGYGIKYDKNRAFTLLRLVSSAPKILTKINKEHVWLKQYREEAGLDAVISDNRYGLWAEGLYSVLITHQPGLRTSLGAMVDRWVQRRHYRLIEHFTVCWVPDQEKGGGLAGELSHPERMPHLPVWYVGLLSRMEAADAGAEDGRGEMDMQGQGRAGVQGDKVKEVEGMRGKEMAGQGVQRKGTDLLVLLSGPEPQRTIIEEQLWGQLGAFAGKVVFVRGLPGGGEVLPGWPHVDVFDHLPAGALNEVMSGAKLVIARAGYSTAMDLVRLKKRSVLIPTPGQAEQEYLGKYLTAKGVALCLPQSGFVLGEALMQADQFSYVPMREEVSLLQDAIDALLEKINPSPLPI